MNKNSSCFRSCLEWIQETATEKRGYIPYLLFQILLLQLHSKVLSVDYFFLRLCVCLVIDKNEKADVYTIRLSCITYDNSPLRPKNIPYLECFSTKTPWWIVLQLSYILMHRTDELLGKTNVSYILSYVKTG